jgi:MFS family permease
VTLVKTFAPPGMESRVLSYATAFGALGIGGGPFLAGQIGPLLGLRAYFALNSCLLLVALGVWLRAMSRGAASEAALRA